MTTYVEHKLLFFRKEIIRCIKEPSIVSHLEADAIISRDESSELKTMYLQGQCFKATEKMIDLLLNSRSRSRWSTFLRALEQSEYGYIKSLLESTNRTGESDDRAREIMKVFSPYLEKNISPQDIITELYSRNVLNVVDREEIMTTYQNKGETCATIVLLERMQCRLAPDEWYYKFLCTLVETGYHDVVKEIEPDFLTCPEQLKPSTNKLQLTEQRGCSESIITPSSTTNMTDVSYDETCQVDCGSQNIMEHIKTDFVDAEEEMDDQGVPEKMEGISCKENAGSMSNTSVLKDFDSDTPRSLENTGKTDTEFSFVDTYECKTFSPSLERLGERKQPEGQDIDVSKSSYGVENDTKLDKAGRDYTKASDSVPGIKSERSGLDITDVMPPEVPFHDDGGVDDTQPLEEKLYLFQRELAVNALDGKNTIVCAPTGSGKTMVALYIIDRHLKSSRTEKKKVAFMARNGALVKQQVDRLSAELAYARVKHIVGDTDESMMMQAFIDDYDVFFFTPQILVNNLSKDLKKMSVFSLLVFDECHHVKGAEPYNMLMRQYLLEKSEGTRDLPQIVGLTATIGTGRAKSEKDALDHIFRICANLDVRCLSLVERNKDDLAKHVSLPSEEFVQLKKRETDPCRGILLEALRETQDILFEKFATVSKLVPVLLKLQKEIETKRYGPLVLEVVEVGDSLQNAQGRDIASCGNFIQIYHNALEINKLLRKQDVAIYIAKQHTKEAEHLETLTEIEKCLLNKLKDVQSDLLKVNVENPNVQAISKLLTNFFEKDDEDSRAMIFVEARATSRALAECLNEDLEKIFVKASPFLGKGKRGSDEGMTEEEQNSVIDDFRDGTLKILVATSVGMEGLDVPDCNLILSYSFTRDEISKTQMPGRSRKEGGKSLMMGTDEQLQKDKIAMYRIKLMNAAIEEFIKLDKNTVSRKVLIIQRKELDDYKWLLKTKNLKRSKLSDDVDYTITCKRCGMFICNTSNVRKLEKSHLVALKDFEEKIRKEAHTKRQNMGQLKKKYKMYCKKCPNDWGVIADKDGVQFFVLKAESLKFKSRVHQNDVASYKKWPEVPYKFKNISLEDLANIYSDSN